jgi:hypothetical protein
MQWTMPPRVIQIVAGLLALISVGAFATGVINAPQRGHLPGQRAESGAPQGTAAPVAATEATPLTQERIEGTPPPPELTSEEKAKLDADKAARAQAEAAAKAATATQAPPPPAPVTPTPSLQVPEPQTPAPEEAPH